MMPKRIAREVELDILEMRQAGKNQREIALALGLSRNTVGEVLRDPTGRARKRRKPPKPAEVAFRKSKKYRCPTCGRSIVLTPCPACLAMAAACKNGCRCFAIAMTRMVYLCRQADCDYRDAVEAFPTDDGSRIVEKF